jgi:competence protein ComGC
MIPCRMPPYLSGTAPETNIICMKLSTVILSFLLLLALSELPAQNPAVNQAVTEAISRM